MRDVEYAILGAGVAGLCTAKILSNAGVSDLVIIDNYSAPGGNQQSFEINSYTYDIGAFYYWRTMPMFKMFPEMLEDCISAKIEIERISPKGQVGPYPFSLRHEFINQGPIYWARTLSSLGRARLNRSHFVTAEDFAVYWMGRKLYTDLGMANYIQRFFGLSADCIEAQFAASRMPRVANLGSFKYWLKKANVTLKETLFPPGKPQANGLIVRPEAGLSHMYGRAVTALTRQGVDVRLDSKLNRIVKKDRRFELSMDGGQVRAANIVSTIPIKQISSFLDISAGQELESVALATLFFSFVGDRKFTGTILYNWGWEGRWKRLTMHSDYYGQRRKREYTSVEVPIFRCDSLDVELLVQDFTSSVSRYNLFQGNLTFEGHRFLEEAYPAYTLGTGEKVASAISQLNDIGIQSAGRQGRFDYLPTGEHVAKQVAGNISVKGRKLSLPP